jgi:hypothetical protein
MGACLGTEVDDMRTGRAKRVAKIPPVLRRATSLPDSVLAIAGGDVGDLMVLVRRTDGLGARWALLGSRTEVLLRTVSARRR